MNASPILQSTPASEKSPALNSSASPHLSAEHLDDHLIGCLDAERAAHLAACPLCSRRAAAAAAPLTSFQRVSTAWSERRSATLTVPAHPRQRPVWQRNLGWATACLTVAVGIAITTSSQAWLALGNSGQQPTSLQTEQANAVHQDSAQQDTAQDDGPDTSANPHLDQVSADNRMLHDIDSALDTSAETPAALGLQTPNDQSTAPPAALQD